MGLDTSRTKDHGFGALNVMRCVSGRIRIRLVEIVVLPPIRASGRASFVRSGRQSAVAEPIGIRGSSLVVSSNRPDEQRRDLVRS